MILPNWDIHVKDGLLLLNELCIVHCPWVAIIITIEQGMELRVPCSRAKIDSGLIFTSKTSIFMQSFIAQNWFDSWMIGIYHIFRCHATEIRMDWNLKPIHFMSLYHGFELHKCLFLKHEFGFESLRNQVEYLFLILYLSKQWVCRKQW